MSRWLSIGSVVCPMPCRARNGIRDVLQSLRRAEHKIGPILASEAHISKCGQILRATIADSILIPSAGGVDAFGQRRIRHGDTGANAHQISSNDWARESNES